MFWYDTTEKYIVLVSYLLGEQPPWLITNEQFGYFRISRSVVHLKLLQGESVNFSDDYLKTYKANIICLSN